jgi:hypothetical protein
VVYPFGGMELRVHGFSAEDMAHIDELAAGREMNRSQYVRWLLLSSDEPLTKAELNDLLAQKARSGSIRAMELLARTMLFRKGTGEPTGEPPTPFAEVIALAEHRLDGG